MSLAFWWDAQQIAEALATSSGHATYYVLWGPALFGVLMAGQVGRVLWLLRGLR